MDVLLVKQLISGGVSGLVASGLLTIGLREWISARIKTSIQHDFDKKLETHKAQLKSDQELAILNVKTALAREEASRASAHASFAEGQKAAMERQLDAVDRLWTHIVEFKKGLPPLALFVDVMTVEDYRKAKDDPQFQELTKESNEATLAQFKLPSIEGVRPYLGEYLWAIFDSYKKIFLRRLFLLRLGQTDADKIEWHKDVGTRNLIEAVLTSAELHEFDNTEFNKLSWLQRQLESKMLITVQKIISGERFGAASLAQARVIQERLAQLPPTTGTF